MTIPFFIYLILRQLKTTTSCPARSPPEGLWIALNPWLQDFLKFVRLTQNITHDGGNPVKSRYCAATVSRSICKSEHPSLGVVLPEQEDSHVTAVLFFLFFFLEISTFASSIAAPIEAPPVQVFASPLSPSDEIVFIPTGSAVLKRPEETSVAETASRLPGNQIRNYSGPGSITTIHTPLGLNAAATSIAVDGIPIQDPLGIGTDLSVIPSSAIDRVEQSMNKIDFKLLGPLQEGERPTHVSILTGSGYTGQTSASYRNSQWLIGFDALGSGGHYPFTDPRSGTQEMRKDNSANRVGATAMYRSQNQKKGQLEILQLLSGTVRTNPGSLSFPTQQRENDVFGLLGLKYSRDRTSGVFAVNYSRTEIAPDEPTRTRGAYVQGTHVFEGFLSDLELSLEDQYMDLSGSMGHSSRHVPALSGKTSFDLDPLSLIPSVRLDAAPSFGVNWDGTLTLNYFVSTDQEFSAYYGYLHRYPDLSSTFGYSSNGFILFENPGLRPERSHSFSLSHFYRRGSFSVAESLFYSRISERSVFESLSAASGHRVSVDQAAILGASLSVQVELTNAIYARSSVLLSSNRDLTNSYDLPYKAPLIASGLLGIKLYRDVQVGVEEQFTGRQFADLSNQRSLPAFAQTHVRLESPVAGGTAFFRITNLLAASGYITEGFPLIGRCYWIGYQQ